MSPSTDQDQHQIPQKHHTPPKTSNFEQSHRTSQANNNEQSHDAPATSKKRYEVRKDPVFRSSPKYPPLLPSKPSLFFKRDDHLIPLLSHDRFLFNSQHTSLCMHPTD